ncbi:MAG: zinc-binding dehydrogenase [Gemmatimonadetes bacterium]|nr:zinc-binding dehydrogenase [Gemmatimonadota bacterium]NIO30641.1 zinc-binding dehydrogenase [Gemmatimonadota bacterium]
MKAAVFWQHGGPEVVEVADVPRPEPGPGQVLIAVRAAALNHLDLWARRGLPGLQFEFPHIGGSDIAGVVEEVGDGVAGLNPGTRALVNPSLWCGSCDWCLKGEESLCTSYKIIGEHVRGGLAEFAAVPAANVLPIPDDLSFEEAAAVPLVYQTAWRGLVSRGRLQAGEYLLVTGASGGVSTAAIQIAKHLGATVFAVTAGPEKVARVRELGADHVIDRLESDFSKEVWKATDKRGVDIAFDSVGEAVWPDLLRALARDGRLVAYGATTGAAGQVEIRLTFWKQLQIIGTTMSSASEFNEVMSLVFEKKLKPVIDVVWPLEDAREAHRRLEAGQQFGKIVLTP